MRFRAWAIAAGCALIAMGAHAGELGMEAPELTGLEWVKGEPISITDNEDENIYVVEFWATWCPPCRTTIPHLTKLQREFAEENVVIIGISDEDRNTVAAFAESQGDEMDYRVAVAPERGPHQAYMEAFEQGGLPTAFVVNREGQVAWYGHPMSLDGILPDIIDGSYDLEAARLELSAMTDIQAMAELASRGEQAAFHERATEAAEKYAELPSALLDLAWLIFNFEGMSEESIALGSQIAKRGFDAMDEPTGVAYLVHAVGLAEDGHQDEAIELLKTGIEKVDDHTPRLKNIMQNILADWEGADTAALQ